MKKFFSVLIALVICLSSAISVLAAGDEFVPSISYKGSPDIVEIEDEDGNKHIAIIIDGDEKLVAYVDEHCLVITPVSEAEESKDIPEDAKKQLLDLYEGLKDGTITIPYELVSSDIDPDKMVIRDLFDASWLCEDHPKLLAEEGNVIEIPEEEQTGASVLAMYTNSVQDSCVLVMLDTAEVAKADIVTEETLLAEAEKFLPLLTVEK